MAKSGVRAGGRRTERFSNASQYWAVWASVSTLKKRRGPSLVSTSTVMSFGSGIMALPPACQLEFILVLAMTRIWANKLVAPEADTVSGGNRRGISFG